MRITRTLAALLLFVGIVLAIGGYLGVIDLRTLRTKATVAASNAGADIGGAVKGGIRSANAGPAAIKYAQICRDNLRKIEGAKRAIAASRPVGGAISWDEIVKQLGGEVLACPNGGKYIVGTLQVPASCTVGDNNTDMREDDHLLAGK